MIKYVFAIGRLVLVFSILIAQTGCRITYTIHVEPGLGESGIKMIKLFDPPTGSFHLIDEKNKTHRIYADYSEIVYQLRQYDNQSLRKSLQDYPSYRVKYSNGQEIYLYPDTKLYQNIQSLLERPLFSD